MSRDTKTSCTDCQKRIEASFVPSASLFPIYRMKRDESNESNDRQRSVRSVTSSVAITYTSDTDEGDYETSSEGMIPLKRSDTEIREIQTKESFCVYYKNKSASLNKFVAFNKNVPSIKEEAIPDSSDEFIENRKITMENTHVHGSLIFVSENLAKSKSMPILKSDIASNISTNFQTMDIALISESSFAREKKMSMIVKRMAPNFNGQQYEARKVESKTMPILCDTTPTAMINDEKSEELVAEVTFRKTKNNHRTMNRDPHRDAIPTFADDENLGNLTNDGDLVDVARNSRSSIKSVYFPPDPSDPPVLPNDFAKSKKHQRVSTDVEALQKIDCELSPLQYQYSETIGKARALGLSGMDFDLGISCCPDQPDMFERVGLSPNEFNYPFNRDRTFLRPDVLATSCNLENRSCLVDNISPSPSFPVVGKPTPPGSRTSCLNDSSNSLQTLSFVIPDLSRTVGSFNGLRSCYRVAKSASYHPATNSHASQRGNVLSKGSCDKCISNNTSRLYREPNDVIKGSVSAWDGWSVREGVDTSPSNVLWRTEYNSHRYLHRTVENSRASNNHFFEVRKRESSVFIMIDDNWPIADGPVEDEETTSKRLNKRLDVFPDDQNSTRVQAEIAICSSKNILPETERENDRICSPFESRLIDHDHHRQISRAVSASTCDPRIGVNLNTKFCTTVEKRYSSRAVSPIQNFLSTTTSPSNMLLTTTTTTTTRVSSIFMQQVHADSTTKVVKIEPPSEVTSVEINDRNNAAVATCKRDFCVQKVDSERENAKNLSKFLEFEKDQADLTERKKHLCLSKEKITIVPIVFPKPSRIADVNFAIPRYMNKIVPQLSYQFVPFEAGRSRRMSSSSKRDDEMSQRSVADSDYLTDLTDKLRSTNEKCWRGSASPANRGSSYTRGDCVPSNVVRNSKRSTRVTISNAKAGEKVREYCKSVAKAIPGMRSSPEDFLCET